MFHDDLFTVDVQRRSVASSLLPCVDMRRMGGKTQFGMDWMGFISFGKKHKDFICKFKKDRKSVV